MISAITANQVFVFGSNSTGFHGEGAAGIALRGERAIKSSPSYIGWRQDPQFLAAMNSPVDSPARIGHWATFGQARGLQHGVAGQSYAIVTVTKPGQRRSIPRREIYNQLVALWKFAAEHPDLEFLIANIGTGYAGWTVTEMREVFDHLILKHGNPPNITWIESTATNLS